MSLIKIWFLAKFARQTKIQMKKEIALDTYDRREQFYFFKEFEEPFFGITTMLTCENAYRMCKSKKVSFFAYYLYAANTAVNAISNFRQRIEEDRIIEYDQIHASSTILRPNNTFGFSHIEHAADFETFLANYEREKERVHNSHNLMPDIMTDQVVHYSALPWITTTAISHSRKFSSGDSCPKITFAKLTTTNNELVLPVSVHAHHALIDGYHVGQLLQKMETLLHTEVEF